MLEFADGSIKAQMSYPDMRYPIQYALTHPLRLASSLPGLDFKRVNSLSFESLDYAHFPCVSLALNAGKNGGTYPTALCAADEIAVQLFLDGMIGFMDISRIVEEVLGSHDNISHPVIEDILQADVLARNKATQVYKRIKT
jgi:1-deoxy-D-xylulose-5-phosphate reductoisomerase